MNLAMLLLTLVALGACESLYLSEQKLTNDKIVEISRRTDITITELHMSDCSLQGVDLSPLINLKQLEVLAISFNVLDLPAIQAISGIVSLKELYMLGCSLKGVDLSSLVALKQLEVLDVAHNVLNSHAIRVISKLVSLRQLMMYRCGLDLVKLIPLGALKWNLLELNVQHNKLSEKSKSDLLRILPFTAIQY